MILRIIAICLSASVLMAATSIETLRQRQLVFRAATAAISPSIVRIETIGGAQPAAKSALVPGGGPTFRQADGPTTGIIWSEDGYIVTSSVNFVREPSAIIVTLPDKRQLVTQLVARDQATELAVIKVDAKELPVPTKLSIDSVNVGQWVLAAGCGFGAQSPTVTSGIVSAKSRRSGVAIQTDAKTSPANYGGPLFDIEGKLVGICVPMGTDDSELAGVGWYDSGIGFAIDVDLIGKRFELLKKGEDLKRGFLGIQVSSNETILGDKNESLPKGLTISMPPASFSEKAGLKEGDVIVAIDDTPIRSRLQLQRYMKLRLAGEVVTVTVLRDGEPHKIEVELAKQDDFAPPILTLPSEDND